MSSANLQPEKGGLLVTTDEAREKAEGFWAMAQILFGQGIGSATIKAVVLSQARPRSFENDCLVLALPSANHSNLLCSERAEHLAQLKACLTDANGGVPVELVLEEYEEEEKNQQLIELQRPRVAAVPAATASAPEELEEVKEAEDLPDEESFDGFITAPCNEFPRNVIWDMAANSEPDDSAIFLHAPSGSGKTHLFKAAKHLLEKRGYRVYYTLAKDFMNRVIEAMCHRSNETMDQVRADIKSNHALMVDDVQDLEGLQPTAKTLEELSYLVDLFGESSNRLLFLAGHHPPSELANMSEALRSRMGMDVEIERPDPPTVQNMINRWLESAGTPKAVSTEAVEWMANSLHPNLRILKNGVKKLCRYSPGRQVDLAVTQRLLGGLAKREDRQVASLSVESIIAAVSAEYKVPIGVNLRTASTGEYKFARAVAVWVSRELLDYSLQTLGKEFGGKDHSSIIGTLRLATSETEADGGPTEEGKKALALKTKLTPRKGR